MEIKKEDKNIIQKCAYNFPAVLLYFGEGSWDKLKPCFRLMANEKDEKIKIPLVSALGEISKILGSQLTESDLLEYVVQDMIYQQLEHFHFLRRKVVTAPIFWLNDGIIKVLSR